MRWYKFFINIRSSIYPRWTCTYGKTICKVL